MPARFTLPDLQAGYERILGRPAQIYRLKDGRSTIFFDRTI